MQEQAPELALDDSTKPDLKSDIWSLGATIMQFLFDQSCWDMHSITKQFSVREQQKALKEVRSSHFQSLKQGKSFLIPVAIV